MTLKRRLLSFLLALTTAASMIVITPTAASAETGDESAAESISDELLSVGGLVRPRGYEISGEDAARINAELAEQDDGTASEADLGEGEYSFSSSYLYDNVLNAAEKTFYDKLVTTCNTVLNSPSKDYTTTENVGGDLEYIIGKASYSSINQARAEKIFWFFLLSNPHFYFVANSYLTDGESLYLCFHHGYSGYNFSRAADRAEAKNALDSLTDSWMPEIDAAKGDLAKETLINSKIVGYLTYDDKGADNSDQDRADFDQSLISGVLKKTTVCAGYSQMTSYFCNAAGLDCFCVTSTGHQWNLVKLYDNWYELDNTWNDSFGSMGKIWVNKSRSTFLEQDKTYSSGNSHTLDSMWTGVKLPSCVNDTVIEPPSVITLSSENFPDAAFLKYVKTFNKDSDNVLSEEELEKITSIDAENLGIVSLAGIENFTKLKTIYAPNNSIQTVDLTKNTELVNLNLYANDLKGLNLAKNTKLETLTVDGNASLKTLDVSRNTALFDLHCASCGLTSLDVSKNTRLTDLYCQFNSISALTLSANTELVNLYCQNNKIKSLNLTLNTKLEKVQCSNNVLETLYVNECTGLNTLCCSGNKLTSIDVSNITGLIEFECRDNQIKSLDVSNNTLLISLLCDNNKLTNLDLSDNADLEFLYCSNNALTSLDLSYNYDLQSIDCSYNHIPELDVSSISGLVLLYCNNNALAYVDISNNSGLASPDAKFRAGGNVYDAGNIVGEFDLSKIDGFDPSKMSNLEGADYDSVNGVLKNINSTVVTYDYNCGNGKTEAFSIRAGKVKSITVATRPSRLTFIEGDSLDVTGGEIKITFDDNTTKTIPMTTDMIPNYDPLHIGKQTLTVNYGEKSATYQITVIALAVIDLEWSVEPPKTFYIDDPLAYGEAEITATYNNGTTKDYAITDAAVTIDKSKYNNQKIGTYTITVKCGAKSLTYDVSVVVDPSLAKLTLSVDSDDFYYDTFADVFAKITAIKNTANDYTITVNKNVNEKTFSFPTFANSITITSDGGNITTDAVSLAPKCSLTLETKITNNLGKQIDVKMPAKTTLTIGNEMQFGQVSGTVTSKLIVNYHLEADKVETFGTVDADAGDIYVITKMSGIGHFDGELLTAPGASVAVTNVGTAEFYMFGENKDGGYVFTKPAVADVGTSLSVAVVNPKNFYPVGIPSGTTILNAADAKKDFISKMTVVNRTETIDDLHPDAGKPLDAFAYGKEIRAEYAGALTLNGENYPNFEQAFKYVKTAGANVITVNENVNAVKFALPKSAGSLVIKGATGAEKITFVGTKSLTSKYDLSITDLKISNLSANGIPAKLTITQSDKRLTLDNVMCAELTAIKGSAKSVLDLGQLYSVTADVSGFGEVNVLDNITIGKTFKVNILNIRNGAEITIPEDCALTVKKLNGEAGASFNLQDGFKPVTISDNATGTIALTGIVSVSPDVQLLNAAKCSLGVFDVSLIKPGDGKDYALTRNGSKVYCRPAVLGFSYNSKKYCTFADIVNEIELLNDGSAVYEVTLYGDYDNNAALKLPKSGKYSSLSVTSDTGKHYAFTFTGNVSTTGNFIIDKTDFFAVNAKTGASVKYKINVANGHSFIVNDGGLGLASAINGANSLIGLYKATFSGAVKANRFFFQDIDGILESITTNTIFASGDQSIKLREKSSNKVNNGEESGSGKISITVVDKYGNAANLRNGTVIFAKYAGSSFNVKMADPNVGLERDTKTNKVTIV